MNSRMLRSKLLRMTNPHSPTNLMRSQLPITLQERLTLENSAAVARERVLAKRSEERVLAAPADKEALM